MPRLYQNCGVPGNKSEFDITPRLFGSQPDGGDPRVPNIEHQKRSLWEVFFVSEETLICNFGAPSAPAFELFIRWIDQFRRDYESQQEDGPTKVAPCLYPLKFPVGGRDQNFERHLLRIHSSLYRRFLGNA